MATHSSVLAWRIPGTAEHGGLPSIGSHRVRHDWSDLAAAAGLEVLSLWCFKDGRMGPLANVKWWPLEAEKGTEKDSILDL